MSERKPVCVSFPARVVAHGPSINPDPAPVKSARVQQIEKTDVRREKRRHPRYSMMLPATVERFREDVQKRLYALADLYELELPAAEQLAREYLAERWRRELARAA